jgi:DNA-3-methyladenine glycosylase I
MFERLILEINQAGLSWLTILAKCENFRAANREFAIARVAKFQRAIALACSPTRASSATALRSTL